MPYRLPLQGTPHEEDSQAEVTKHGCVILVWYISYILLFDPLNNFIKACQLKVLTFSTKFPNFQLWVHNIQFTVQKANPSGKLTFNQIQCSAWSLLCLEKDHSDNGRDQEEDGEVGGGAGHKAHGGSNVELSESSEIILKFC